MVSPCENCPNSTLGNVLKHLERLEATNAQMEQEAAALPTDQERRNCLADKMQQIELNKIIVTHLKGFLPAGGEEGIENCKGPFERIYTEEGEDSSFPATTHQDRLCGAEITNQWHFGRTVQPEEI